MELEWDEDKRQRTARERHLDFADVARFDYDTVVTWPDDRYDYGEVRFNSYGYLDGVLCTYCFTWREGRMRVISMRKVNERERKRYEAGQNPRHA
jgi:uncharacterized DUF497 family protein